MNLYKLPYSMFTLLPEGKISLILALALNLAGSAYAQVSGDSWPIFRGESSLAGDTDNEITESPALAWSLIPGKRSISSPVLSEGVIYFGDNEGVLHAVSSDGKPLWRYSTGSIIESPPLVAGELVITGSSDGILHAVNRRSGLKAWSYAAGGQIMGSANYWRIGTTSGVVFGSYDFFLHCVDPSSGKSKWRLETDNYVNGTPAIEGSSIVFGGCDGIIRIVDPVTGQETDTVQIGVYVPSSPAISGSRAFFGDYDGNLYALDLKSKKIAWRVRPSPTSGAFLAIPAARDNYVIIGNEDRYLYCFNASTGEQLWKFRTNGAIAGSAVITPSKVIFGSNDGNIYILRLEDGSRLWSFNAGISISSSPIVDRNGFYFLTEEGRILYFGKKSSNK